MCSTIGPIGYTHGMENRSRIVLLSLIAAFSLACEQHKDNDGSVDPGYVTQVDVNASIAAHAEQASAHHTKTTDAAELTSGTLDPNRLPPLATADVAGSGSDGSVMPHECAWVLSNNTANSVVRTATCPTGKHPIGGSCVSNSFSIQVLASEPVQGASIIPDGALITDADGWTCLFSTASTQSDARALCCYY